jgi:hypothetical protein
MTDHTYNKLDLAAEQRDVAISLLFESQSLVSVLTLAGAAEQTLGKALSHRGEQNALDRKYETVEPIHKLLHGTPLSMEAFIRDENRALNAVTHMESPSDTSVTLDLEEAALGTIVRAFYNYSLLVLLSQKVAAD